MSISKRTAANGRMIIRITPRRRLRAEFAAFPGPDQLHELVRRLETIIEDLTDELCRFVLDREEDIDDRITAGQALGVRPAPAAIPALILALDELGTEPIGTALLRHGPAVNEYALGWLQSPTTSRRVGAAHAFSRVFDPRSVPLLLRSIRDQNADVRRAACWALANHRCDAALRSLCRALARDPNVGVRRSAAEALGVMGDPRAAGPLGDAAARDFIADVRTSAAFGLELLSR